MTRELSRMRRRPLLTPLILPMLGLLAAAWGVYWLGSWASTTTVVLLRHAEPATGPGGDPDLSKAGERRVAMLGKVLTDLLPEQRVDYLYAADTRRAQQTAAAIANQFQLPINLVASSDWDALGRRIQREHRGRNVVVVGYASTLPGVIEQLTGEAVPIGEDEYDSIFVAVLPRPGDPRLLRLRYGSASEAESAASKRK